MASAPVADIGQERQQCGKLKENDEGKISNVCKLAKRRALKRGISCRSKEDDSVERRHQRTLSNNVNKHGYRHEETCAHICDRLGPTAPKVHEGGCSSE